MCIWPWPASSSSCVCGSRWYLMVLSSSSRRCIAVLILSSSPRLFGSMAYDEHRLGERNRRERDAGALVGEGVVGARVFQLRDRAEISGLELRHVGRRLALQRDQVAQPLRRALRGVDHRRIRLQATLIDAEHRDAARELIGHRLPHERRVRRLIISGLRDRFLVGDRRERTIGGRGQIRENRVHHRLRADVLQARRAHQRDDLGRGRRRRETLRSIPPGSACRPRKTSPSAIRRLRRPSR